MGVIWTHKEGKQMDLTVGEKIKIIMKRQGISMTELSERIGQSRQNLSNKMSRDNFTEADMRAIASALSCEVRVEFHLSDGTSI